MGTKDVNSKNQRIVRNFRAKVNSGSVDLKNIQNEYKMSLQEYKFVVDRIIKQETRVQSIDPDMDKFVDLNGFKLDIDTITPGPATYNPKMESVWPKNGSLII